MELSYILEPSHVREIANLPAAEPEPKKQGKFAEALHNARVNILGGAVLYLTLLATFWIVNWVSGYRMDGVSLLVGLVVGFASTLVAVALNRRALKKSRERNAPMPPPQHCHLSVSPEAIQLSRNGYDQIISLKTVGAVTSHRSALVVWHLYGYVIVPRSAFSEPSAERKFLDLVRSSSGSTLN
jgi:hypothetical protein